MGIHGYQINRITVLLLVLTISIFYGIELSWSISAAFGIVLLMCFSMLILANIDLALLISFIVLPFAMKKPFGPIDFSIGEYFLLPVILIGLLSGFYSKRQLKLTISDHILLLFNISACLSLLISFNNEHAWGVFRRIFMCSAFYLVLKLNIHKKDKTIMIMRFIVLSGAFTALIGILQHYTGHFGFRGDIVQRGYLRLITTGSPGAVRAATGTLRTFNFFAAYLGFVFPLSLAMIFCHYKKYSRVIYLLLSFVIFAGIFFSYSRGGLGATLAGIAVFALFFLFFVYKADASKKILPFIFITCFIGAVIIFINFLGASTTYSKSLNFNVRAEIWRSCWTAIKENPLFGVGLGNASAYMIYAGRGYGTHSNYVSILLEQGFFGLGTFLLLLFTSLIKGLQNLRVLRDRNLRVLNIGLLSALIIFMIHSFVDDSLAFPIFWVILFSVVWLFDQISISDYNYEKS